jgi:hypothetical protein
MLLFESCLKMFATLKEAQEERKRVTAMYEGTGEEENENFDHEGVEDDENSDYDDLDESNGIFYCCFINFIYFSGR